jgi:hypothetical protein
MHAITPAERKLVFVGGLHRSGTTVVAECLTDHHEVSGFSNTGAEHDEGQFLQTVYPIARSYGGPGRFGFDNEARLTETSKLATVENALQLWREWSVLWDLNCSVLLEKSPPNLIRYRFLQAVFPNAYFVTVVRHPLAVAFATKKWSKTSMSSLVKHWLRCHDLWLEDSQVLSRQYAFKYEEFVSSPETILNSLFTYLDLKPIPLQREVINSNTRYFIKWKDRQRKWWSRYATNTLVSRFDKEVSRFGYSLRDCDSIAPLPELRQSKSKDRIESPQSF